MMEYLKPGTGSSLALRDGCSRAVDSSVSSLMNFGRFPERLRMDCTVLRVEGRRGSGLSIYSKDNEMRGAQQVQTAHLISSGAASDDADDPHAAYAAVDVVLISFFAP